MRLLLPLILLPAACAVAPDPVGPALAPAAAAVAAPLLLAEHNRERLAAGVPPLVWDPALATAAADYARHLAMTGVLRHSSRQTRTGQGENLWMGTRGAFAPWQMATSWASEKRQFQPGIFPAVSRTGNWADVGHYSQMIWPTTTRLGCALAAGPRVDVLVCRYSPTGNIDGRRVP